VMDTYRSAEQKDTARVIGRRASATLVLIFTLLACSGAHAQDADLSAARDLYASAAYDDALTLLNRLRAAEHPASQSRATQVSDEINRRFDIATSGVATGTPEQLHKSLTRAEVVFATAVAGVQVMTAADLAHAKNLLIAADVNAVPPEGIAGVNVMDDGKPLAGAARGDAIGIGALAIGNVKYQVEHRLFVRMRTGGKPVYLGFPEAFDEARAIAAGPG